ncbi:MAG: class I SAM-dependent methyltransferase [Candidatus Dojkabacteria bacterium]
MWVADKWQDFKVLDAGEGEKLEQWGKYILRRPDPQAIWNKKSNLWDKADAFYHRNKSGGGFWENINKIPDFWEISYDNLKFNIKPTSFKHTGLFPEQAVNWEWIIERITREPQSLKILNLFAYTGGATVAALSAGAEVVHIDASRGMIELAKANVESSNLLDKKVRFIQDDVIKFVQREIRRGNKYHGIIMDPPAFGRGKEGEIWEIEKSLNELITLCKELLSDDASFMLINSYANDISRYAMENILKDQILENFSGKVYSNEIGLSIETRPGLFLPCGVSIRWERD